MRKWKDIGHRQIISRQYHIQVAQGEVGRYVIMPGDPSAANAMEELVRWRKRSAI